MSVHTYTNKKMPTGMWGQDDRWSLSGTNSAESPPGIRQRQRVMGKEGNAWKSADGPGRRRRIGLGD